jgi:phage terminase large subunit
LSFTVDRAGKTVAAVNDLIERGLYTKKPDAQFAYVAPQLKQAKRIAWDYLKRYSKHVTKKVNEAELYVELVNGSKIYVFGADDPDSARGLYFDGIVMDEVAQIKPSFWSEVVRPALADRKGWAVFMGTPKGKGNMLYQRFQKAKEKPDAFFLMVLKASESGILGPRELAEMKEDMEEAEYQQELECSFEAALKGSYYGEYITKLDERGKLKSNVEYDGSEKVSLAMDIGYNDATAIWFWQIVNGEVRFVDYWEETGWDAEELAGMLALRPYNYETWYVPHDAFHKTFQTKKSVYDTFREFDAPVRRAPDPDRGNRIFHGIDAVRKTLRTYPIVFDKDSCAKGLESLRNYSREWSSKNGQLNDSPNHDKYSHGADAFRYACLSINETEIANSVLKAIERSKLDKAMGSMVLKTMQGTDSAINRGITLQQAIDAHVRSRKRKRSAGRARI